MHRQSSAVPWVVACSLLVLGIIAGAVIGVTSHGTTPSPDTVPLLNDFYGGSFGRPIVTISVGSSKPIKVLLDTGSVGLRVTARSLDLSQGGGVMKTSHRISITFADGAKYNGTLARASVHIGSQTTTTKVPFEVVTSVDCGRHVCGTGEPDMDGILGIALNGPSRGQPLPNPLLSLPQPYSSRWSVSVGQPITATTSGELVLGTAEPAHATVFALQRLGRSRFWYDYLDLCWSIAGGTHELPTLLDSGALLALVHSDSVEALAAPDTGFPALPSNIPVSVNGCETKSPVINFTTDTEINPVALRSSTGADFANLGVQVFYANVITYDTIRGEIALTASTGALSPQR